jgi:hypothetical protein
MRRATRLRCAPCARQRCHAARPAWRGAAPLRAARAPARLLGCARRERGAFAASCGQRADAHPRVLRASRCCPARCGADARCGRRGRRQRGRCHLLRHGRHAGRHQQARAQPRSATLRHSLCFLVAVPLRCRRRFAPRSGWLWAKHEWRIGRITVVRSTAHRLRLRRVQGRACASGGLTLTRALGPAPPAAHAAAGHLLHGPLRAGLRGGAPAAAAAAAAPAQLRSLAKRT